MKQPLALVVDQGVHDDSLFEAEQACELAESMGLESRLLRLSWDTQSLPKMIWKECIERRYRVMHETCRMNGATSLFTGHNAENSAEMFLFRLVSASGLEGLTCMKHIDTLQYNQQDRVDLVRPLLDARRTDIKEFCDSFGMPYLEHQYRQASDLRRHIGHILTRDAKHFTRTDENNGSGVGDLFDDLLSLQRVCRSVSVAQDEHIHSLLQDALVHAVLPEQESCAKTLTLYEDIRNLCKMRSSNGEKSRSKRISDALKTLQKIPHGLLHAKPFSEYDDYVAANALSKLMHMISMSEYPPTYADCFALQQMLKDGRCRKKFTGGGCHIEPVVKSKGRYFTISSQKYRNKIGMERFKTRSETVMEDSFRNKSSCHLKAASG